MKSNKDLTTVEESKQEVELYNENIKLQPKELVVKYSWIFLGTLILNLGFYFFFAPNNVVTGGVSGSAIILHDLLNKYGVELSHIIYLLNGFFLLLGLIVLGKEYTIASIPGSILSPVIINALELFKIPTNLIFDHLTEAPILISTILGALSVGLGLGIVFRNGGSTGGVDILQHILNRKLHINYQTAFIITDGIVVLIGLLVFRDVQTFIFAIGAILLFSIIVDNLSIAGRAGHTLFIVTDKSTDIKNAIYNNIERGTTILDAKGGYSQEDKNLVICVINKKQLILARHVVSEADPDAFIFIAQTKEAVGRGFTHD